MKQFLLPAVAAAVIFPLYALFGNAAFSLVIGLFIGTVIALYYFDLIGLNGAVVLGVAVVVAYLLMGKEAFYLFSFLFGVFFCVIGLYALFELLQPPEYRGSVLLLLAISAPVAFGIGGYLVWIGLTELGLLTYFGIEDASHTGVLRSLPMSWVTHH